MTMPTFLTSDRLRDACRNRCAFFGDPPCWEIAEPGERPGKACGECLRDVGFEPGDEFDHNAAIRPLL